MNNFRKIFLLIALIFVLGVSLVSCNTSNDGDKISIVCSDFAQYDWTRNILGENAEKFSLTYLLDDGSDPHSFQPAIADMAMISDCDLFIFTGGSGDKWSREAVKNANNKDMEELCIYELFKDSILPMANSSCSEEHTDHDHDHTGEDEHLWLSLENAKKAAEAICEKICKIHPEGRETYIANLKKYTEELSSLDAKYKKAVTEASGKTLVFADRFPFAYLVRDYSLEYYSAYSGCSADSELSEDRIIFLAEKIDALELKFICVTETADLRLASTVIGQTEDKNAEILEFNSCQSVTAKQVESGITYIGVMELNLEALKKALG